MLGVELLALGLRKSRDVTYKFIRVESLAYFGVHDRVCLLQFLEKISYSASNICEVLAAPHSSFIAPQLPH